MSINFNIIKDNPEVVSIRFIVNSEIELPVDSLDELNDILDRIKGWGTSTITNATPVFKLDKPK